jgi:hypothetical protein
MGASDGKGVPSLVIFGSAADAVMVLNHMMSNSEMVNGFFCIIDISLYGKRENQEAENPPPLLRSRGNLYTFNITRRQGLARDINM